MITNLNAQIADIELSFIFEEKDPVEGIKLTLDRMRTTCTRLYQSMGDQNFTLGTCYSVHSLGKELSSSLRMLRSS